MNWIIKMVGMGLVIWTCDTSLKGLLIGSVGVALISASAHQLGYKEALDNHFKEG